MSSKLRATARKSVLALCNLLLATKYAAMDR